MWTKFYIASGVTLLLLYAVAGFLGWEIGAEKQQFIPASVRQSPGGYRSFHFWHSGYQGGK